MKTTGVRIVIPAHQTEILSCDWCKYDEVQRVVLWRVLLCVLSVLVMSTRVVVLDVRLNSVPVTYSEKGLACISISWT